MELLTAEPPECPVCLTPYDASTTIPRVLPCGHSTCQPCLTHLPNPFPNTIRCPSCTHLVNFQTFPSSFPKNFDLLRVSSLLQPHQPSIPKKVISPPIHSTCIDSGISFIPNLFPYDFYANWVKWVLQKDVVCVEPLPGKETNDKEILKKSYLNGHVKKSNNDGKSLFGCVLRDGEKVGLVKVGTFVKGKDGDGFLNYRYEAKLIKVLYGMGEKVRDEIGLLLNASLRLHRVGKVYGFWCDENDDSVYMVCQGFHGGLAKIIKGFECGFNGKSEEERLKKQAFFGMVSIEVCETVSCLHSEGLIIGCLSLSCFGFDDFGRVYINFGELVEMGREVRRMIVNGVLNGDNIVDENLKLRPENDIFENCLFLCPEVLLDLLRKEGVELEWASSMSEVGCGSDIWSLACIIIHLFIGKSFVEEMCNYYLDFLSGVLAGKKDQDCRGLYTSSLSRIIVLLEITFDMEFVSLKEILLKCFEFDPQNRPALTELWKCIRGLLIKPDFDVTSNMKLKVAQESGNHCLILGDLCEVAKDIKKKSTGNTVGGFQEKNENYKLNVDVVVDRDVVEGVSRDHVQCIELKGHLDCITGLAVGGGFLFSSSYDKIVNVWSLQDYSHVHSFKGHEHRVMAVVFVDEEESLCISGDNGGLVCIWSARVPFDQEPKTKLSEQKDWRFSGIHALAVSGTGYLYTGSGDKTIKAWSLQDYNLECTMSGHKSVVSSLAVGSGVLYSGSWDGTVRLWCLNNHSPLAVLGEDTPGSMISVLSLAADSNVLVVAHEDGHIKIWQNDVLQKSELAQNGAIFAVIKEGKWLFTGGWNKTISVQGLSGDGAKLEITPVGSIPSGSPITALAYWQGKLFAGQADRVIKVYHSRF